MKVATRELVTRAPFKDLFPIEPDVVKALAGDMRANGFDAARSVIVWRASDGAPVVVDGHMRLAAAKQARLREVHATIRKFADEDAAFAFAVAAQRDRRNLTHEQIATAIARAELARGEELTSPTVARSFSGPGKRGGSTKDPVRTAVVDKAAKAGVGKRTAERGLAKAKAERDGVNGKTRKPAEPPKPPTLDGLRELHTDGQAAAKRVGPLLAKAAKSQTVADAEEVGRAAFAASQSYGALLKRLTKYIEHHERNAS